ncbi:MAG: hypothetical protein GYA39_04460 [Methanothrix sp.]|nr:hypothetical protein [Methanothrix sp.]
MEDMSWDSLVEQLEREASTLQGGRTGAQDLKRRVAKALQEAESASLGFEIIDRLEVMLMALTEAAKENVCTNTKCPHYNKKCKMR